MSWELVGRMWGLTSPEMRRKLTDDALAGLDFDDLPPGPRGRLLVSATSDGWNQLKYQEVKRALSQRNDPKPG